MSCPKCPFTKEEILALKVCAKEKLAEPTPEQEEEWERDTLDDQWGDSL
jgi:hypothetical protein